MSRSRRAPSPPVAASDPAESARVAGLRYVTHDRPGIRRIRTGRGFRHAGPDGAPVRDPETLARIRRLAIPPAWTGVWICPVPSGHLQAVGVDARGRRQYRYHPRWRAARDETKYGRMVEFARALPRLRARVDAGLRRPGLPREKVLATVVRLLETTLMRVGNDEYARENGSYGLTTLRDQHVRVDGASVRLRFRGKGGVEHEVTVSDRRVARIVRRCQDVPGQELFQYVDEAGQRQAIDSADVNAYVRDAAGDDFTAKDFRTWAGTVLAAVALQELDRFSSAAQARRNVKRAVEAVARLLGNTPTICRKAYVHPAVIDAYLEGPVTLALKERAEREIAADLAGLSPQEAAVVALLQQRLAREIERDAARAA